MTKDDFIKIYCAQYKILEDKMIDLSEYITIDKSNYPTFSLQLNALFILICNEIDSVAGEICKSINDDRKSIHGIIKKIEVIVTKYPNLKNSHISTKYPHAKIDLVPFTKFEPNTHSWWTDYNDIKHNRAEQDEHGRYNFQKANLKNVLHSIAALYILIVKISQDLKIENFSLNSKLFNETVL